MQHGPRKTYFDRFLAFISENKAPIGIATTTAAITIGNVIANPSASLTTIAGTTVVSGMEVSGAFFVGQAVYNNRKRKREQEKNESMKRARIQEELENDKKVAGFQSAYLEYLQLNPNTFGSTTPSFKELMSDPTFKGFLQSRVPNDGVLGPDAQPMNLTQSLSTSDQESEEEQQSTVSFARQTS